MTFTINLFRALLLIAIVFLALAYTVVSAENITPSVDPVVTTDAMTGSVLGASITPSLDPVVLGASTDTPEDNPVSYDTVHVYKTVTATLNVRLSPSTATQKIGQVTKGTIATIKYGPIEADGYNWYSVSFTNGLSGWVASDWLE